MVAVANVMAGDTIAARELHEVVVQAPKLVHKADMDIYYPSRGAVENSKNGVQLLANLMIPAVMVNETLGAVSSGGEAVQIRINGREASVEQISNLLPASIKQVEWIENPGLRYNGAKTVLNFVVVNPTSGGALMLNASQAVNMAFGKYDPNVKINSGRSQFEFGGHYKLTENIKAYRDYTESFTFPDGITLTRNETPRGGRLSNSAGNIWANYNYIKPDTSVVIIEARGHFRPVNSDKYYGLMTTNGQDADILLSDISGNKGFRPSLSAYWEQHFSGNQTLVVDFKGEYYSGQAFSDYMEQHQDSHQYITDIHTDIEDNNQAYAAEANYIKKWNGSSLTTGAQYTANRNRSVYKNLDGQVFHQRQDKVYFFAEYLHRFSSLTFVAGIGAQYSDIFSSETNRGSKSWNMRPQASLTYNINPKHQLRLIFESWQSTPSLAETNPTPQQFDGFQWRIGNPDIKTADNYMLTLRYNFRMPQIYGQVGIKAFTSPNAIAPVLRWEDEKLVTTYENSQGQQNISIFFSPQIEVIPHWLTVSGQLQWRAEQSKGLGYCITNNGWSGNASILLQHWGFTLSGQFERAQRNLWGQKISWGEDINIIELKYNTKRWGALLGFLMPFGKYDQGAISLSEWKKYEKHTRINFCMPYIGFSYNLQWGHQRRKADKLINVSGSADQSKTAGR